MLVFLGVEPYCRIRGSSGNAALIEPFWEKKVSVPYSTYEQDAYELVICLLSQVMLRHSKKHLVCELNLQDRDEQLVMLEFEDASERAVYLTLEAYAQEETLQILASINRGQGKMEELEVLADLIACASTHPSLVQLRHLEELLQKTFDAGVPPTGDHMRITGLFGQRRTLKQLMLEISNTHRGYQKLLDVNHNPSSRSCIYCMVCTSQITAPVLLHCCLEIMCKEHVFQANDHAHQTHHSARSSFDCPHCNARLTPKDFTPLATPLSISQHVDQSAIPAAAASLQSLQVSPRPARLQALRHWVCDGAQLSATVGGSSSAIQISCGPDGRDEKYCCDGFISRKPLHCEVDGMRFCSRQCALTTFNRAFFFYPEDRFCLPTSRTLRAIGQRSPWRGKLAKQKFGTPAAAAEAFKESLKALEKDSWDGVPLYEAGKASRVDPSYMKVSNFRVEAGVPAGRFLAHYDAAGGERPYGVHPGTRLGTKLNCVVNDVHMMPTGSKVVIFSASHRTLMLLKDALCSKHSENAISIVGGADSAQLLTRELKRFREEAECFVLLLAVRMCAQGLTLTCADHCFLVEPQEDEATEVQLINRVYRIGQLKPVVIKKYAMRGTIEERRLTHRRSAGGLLSDETDQAGASTAQAAKGQEEDGGGGAVLDLRRLNTLRYLVGLG